MVHDVHAARRAREGGGVLEIPTNNLDPGGLEILICAFPANKRPHLIPTLRQRAREMPARKSGGAGD